MGGGKVSDDNGPNTVVAWLVDSTCIDHDPLIFVFQVYEVDYSPNKISARDIIHTVVLV